MLVIRPAQLEAFQSQVDATFEMRVVEYLREEHGEDLVRRFQPVSLLSSSLPSKLCRKSLKIISSSFRQIYLALSNFPTSYCLRWFATESPARAATG
jgi:hypothetical protein